MLVSDLKTKTEVRSFTIEFNNCTDIDPEYLIDLRLEVDVMTKTLKLKALVYGEDRWRETKLTPKDLFKFLEKKAKKA